MTEYTEKFLKRFWAKVCKGAPTECWNWIGAKRSKGYGSIVLGDRQVLAHRISFELAKGRDELLKYEIIRHDCDNPACVNPAHLRGGSPGDNFRDQVERDRRPYGSRNPKSKLTEQAVAEIRSGSDTLEHICAMMLKYRVGELAIRSVLNRQSWKHVK